MLRPRIIPCLLMSQGGLIKTKRFADPKYVGDPINAVKIFNEKAVDELAIFDIHAWKGADLDYGLLEKIARESRMPLCYGGGITKAEQAERIVQLGFEKVSVSSAAIRNPGLVGEMSRKLGGQSVVVTIDVLLEDPARGRYSVWIQNGGKKVDVDLLQLCRSVAAEGAGEIVINSIDREGSMQGFDLDLAKRLTAELDMPMTFVGGCGKVADMSALIDAVGVVGVGVGSLFVFRGPFRAVLISYAKP